MAPRTRAKKAGKENVGSIKKSKFKESCKVTKPSRKPLADKTNSASDENATIDVTKKGTVNFVKNSKHSDTIADDEKNRPRRQRRIPNRFIGDDVLNTSVDKNVILTKPQKSLKSKDNNNLSAENLSKTPRKVKLDSSLSSSRPKRISRLPSRLEDHSISPSKFIPVQPCSASTPIAHKQTIKKDSKASKGNCKATVSKSTGIKTSRTGISTKVAQQKTIDSFVNLSSESNNPRKKKTNAKTISTKVAQKKTIESFVTLSSDSNYSRKNKTNAKNKVISPIKKNSVGKKYVKKVFEKSFSFRVLENKRSENNHENKDDVYEFTFDPTEEPTPQKKKRKKVVKRKPVKPKIVYIKSNYNKKLSQSLQALKSVLKKNACNSNVKNFTERVHENKNYENSKQATEEITNAHVDNKNPGLIKNQPNLLVNTTQNTDNVNNHASVRIEDIAAAFEPTPDHHDIDYSPVNTPNRCPATEPVAEPSIERTAPANDPLNLQQELSFFDEQPVASSSMNLSTRHPTASPWRVDYENLPIKWNVNTYVKPNMTPAIECSYVDNNNSRKKHVYTNILQEPNTSVPDAETITTHLKQTSIISFIKELVNKSVNKKKKKPAVTPTKQNSLFEDTAISTIESHLTASKSDSTNNPSDNSANIEKDTETSPEIDTQMNDINIKETRKRKNKDPIYAISKTPRKDKDQTLFGFDDSENCDQENVSPKKVVDKRRNRNLRPRAVLQEINKMAGPTRAVVPAKDKLAVNSEVINKMYEELKTATPAPIFPVEAADKNPDLTNLENDDSQSMHLFEDIELIHHVKPTRKSYGKAKKVTFRQHSSDSNDSRVSDADPERESYDDLADLSFEIPAAKAKKTGKKKMTKKQKKTKEENKELEEWAAQFNSMCNDIEHVDLVVE